jgi:hypothetical protein
LVKNPEDKILLEQTLNLLVMKKLSICLCSVIVLCLLNLNTISAQDPEVITRKYFIVHAKSFIMNYLDNLIAWGDQLFDRDSSESIESINLQEDILPAKPQYQ